MIVSVTDVNIVDARKQTALHIAARRGNIIIVRALVMQGCNINSRDVDGNTAADEAGIVMGLCSDVDCTALGRQTDTARVLREFASMAEDNTLATNQYKAHRSRPSLNPPNTRSLSPLPTLSRHKPTSPPPDRETNAPSRSQAEPSDLTRSATQLSSNSTRTDSAQPVLSKHFDAKPKKPTLQLIKPWEVARAQPPDKFGRQKGVQQRRVDVFSTHRTAVVEQFLANATNLEDHSQQSGMEH